MFKRDEEFEKIKKKHKCFLFSHGFKVDNRIGNSFSRTFHGEDGECEYNNLQVKIIHRGKRFKFSFWNSDDKCKIRIEFDENSADIQKAFEYVWNNCYNAPNAFPLDFTKEFVDFFKSICV